MDFFKYIEKNLIYITPLLMHNVSNNNRASFYSWEEEDGVNDVTQAVSTA